MSAKKPPTPSSPGDLHAADNAGAEKDGEWTPVLPPEKSVTREQWEVRRAALRARWLVILGHAELEPFERTPRLVRRFELPVCTACEYLLPTTASSNQAVLLMVPRNPPDGPRPGAVVPFYNPDLMAGYDLESGEAKEAPAVHFGRHLVEMGFTVVCGQAFPFNTVNDPGTGAPFAHWHVAAEKLREQYPAWTGMGRLIHDTGIATDFLLEQPDIDPERILIMGHSLGGKMAFYAGCLDARIKAIIASDFGIAFASTNWDAPWYLGEQVHDPALGVGHQHLLALAAPTPFLLLAGDCDGARSRPYLEAARAVYRLYGHGDALTMIHHGAGHRPPIAAMQAAYRWLGRRFGFVPGNCRIETDTP
jgi:predicted esterase